ncbi:hypothetical protein EIN_281530 [Entamoeba invadens IP1]|uniref:Uncharacterized protein n=2 Tax=Entamoeba invadens TaxID=33085 RepID=A0A0A1TX11_ENTIV|nr:hypothetical protein EIN_281530 [Entamoeba invadens IP1]ELP85782.1 hypothetical protein EIN_281530 [Entamoeba invadens IP1]BAN42186.1 hypothetical protein [Entamoeba invadens]|eukprot:XP_004185128.1 hypothetical protein EIN_281530 [Entamoeba invadens IP1]
MTKPIDPRLDTKYKIFLYNELVSTTLISEDVFFSEIEEPPKKKPDLPSPGFSSPLITKFAEGPEWATQKKQILEEYPFVKEKYHLEVEQMHKYKENDFFKEFFASRYFGDTEKNASNSFQETYRRDENEKEKVKKTLRGTFYEKEVASIELKNDGWEGFGTRGITWGVEMMSCRQLDYERNLRVSKTVENINWHSEVVVRQLGKHVKNEESVKYAVTDTKRVNGIRDIGYTSWDKVDPEWCGPIHFESQEKSTLGEQQSDLMLNITDLQSVAKRVGSEQILRFELLCSFCLKCYWKNTENNELKRKFKKIIQNCAEYAEKLLQSCLPLQKPLLDQVVEQLHKAISVQV